MIEDTAPGAADGGEGFFARSAPLHGEIVRLMTVAREVLHGEFPEAAALGARALLGGDPLPVLTRLVQAALPPAALEVLAGLAGVVHGGDYVMAPYWDRSLPWIEPTDDATLRALPSLGGEVLAAIARVALIGAGGTLVMDAARVRPALWSQRDRGPAWTALCHGLDAIAGGSFAGHDALRALAVRHEASPAIVWLDEVAARLAREDARAAARAQRLNSLLDAGTFGANATELVGAVQLGRRLFAQEGTRLHDAWLLLAARERPRSPLPEPAIDTLPAPRRTAIRRAARQGNELAQLVERIDAMLAEAQQVERATEEREGPFYLRGPLPPSAREPIEAAIHCAVLGFRQCYGLELLRDALPALAAWAREHAAGASRAA